MTYSNIKPTEDWEFNCAYKQKIDIFGEMPNQYEIYVVDDTDELKYHVLDQSNNIVYKFGTRKELIAFIVENSNLELYTRQ